MSTDSFEFSNFSREPGRYELLTGTIVESKPRSIERETTLKGPYDWLIKKSKQQFKNPINERAWYDIALCHLVFSFEKRSITLFVHEHDHEGSVIIRGRMTPNPVLAALKINQNELTTPKNMAAQLKMKRLLFADLNEHLTLISNLEKFKIRVEQELVNEADKTGQKRAVFEQKVKHEIPLSFTLDTQIFLGYPEQKFKVEVCFDVRDRAVEMWLESVELYELMNTLTIDAIQAEVTKFEADFPDLAILEC